MKLPAAILPWKSLTSTPKNNMHLQKIKMLHYSIIYCSRHASTRRSIAYIGIFTSGT